MFTLTSEHALVPVVFRDTTLFLVEHNNEPFVPMKPVVEGMGMAWQPQLAKLNSTPRWGITIIVIPSESGEQKTACLPLRKLPGWLNSVSPNKVDASIRPKVIAYQNECDDVLWQHWSGKQSPAPPPSLPTPEPTAPTLKLPLRFEGWSRDGVTISELRYLADDAVVLPAKDLNIIIARSGDEIVKRIADIEISYIPAIIGAAMQRLTALTTPLMPQPA